MSLPPTSSDSTPGRTIESRAPTTTARPGVLLVDDVPVMVKSLAIVLRDRVPHIDIHTTTSARGALDILRRVDVDVVLTDVLMPEMDGITLLEQARTIDPDALFLIISGVEAGDITRRALRAGAYDFILKPVDPEHLEASLRRALETRRLRREVAAQQEALQRHAETLERAVEERTRELREANRTKDEFLATMSHELRTPLTAVLGWARLLKSARLDEETREQAIDSIARNASSQSQLIDDLLDISSIITGRLRLKLTLIDLGAVMAAAIDVVRTVAGAKGVELAAVIDPGIGHVFGDAERLKQVFWNILSNAVKFTPAGGRVELRASQRDHRVEIVTTDSGSGIDPKFLPFVFDRFRQGDGALSGARRGLGLGLAIAKHLVELHGGRIAVDSDGLGTGARFTVTLPVSELTAANEGKAAPRIQSRPETDTSDLRGVRALVVDDDPDTREVLRTVLQQAGATVVLAETADEAIVSFRETRPDILLCDIGLPDRDGYSVLREIRAMPAWDGGLTPAIALTAHAKSEDRARALSVGFAVHLPKPGPPDLVSIVESLVDSAHDDRATDPDEAR